MRWHPVDIHVLPTAAVLLLLSQTACDAGSLDRGVRYERLLSAEADSGSWLTYSGSYNGRRFSRLSQIDRSNVHLLQAGWSYPLDVPHAVETTPLVVDGVMYLTRPPSDVVAVDVRTGEPLWEFSWPIPDGIRVCCGLVNRGVAMLNETLYLGTIDAHLVALDAATGKKKWSVRVADHKLEFSITGAPLVVKDMVLTGVGITQRKFRPDRRVDTRAYIDAYDAETGKLRWRFYAVPGPGEPGNETWADDSWLQGGASTWMTGTFDPALNLLYWGIGNPIPTLFGEYREGDNLYSASVVALDPDSGIVRWHHQFTPHDVHDWDATQVPVLADMDFDGQPRRLLLTANRNGFYYVLDRVTGAFLNARQFARQTWAAGIDSTGRPILLPGKAPSYEGVLVAPTVPGATNWWAPSFSPNTELFYVMAHDGTEIYRRPRVDWMDEDEISRIEESWVREIDTSSYVAAVRALDARTGELRWELPLPPHTSSGILTTASNLLFVGTTQGEFLAVDAVGGDVLWRGKIDGWIHAGPISYVVDGRQILSIASSEGIYTFGLSPDAPISATTDH